MAMSAEMSIRCDDGDTENMGLLRTLILESFITQKNGTKGRSFNLVEKLLKCTRPHAKEEMGYDPEG